MTDAEIEKLLDDYFALMSDYTPDQISLMKHAGRVYLKGRHSRMYREAYEHTVHAAKRKRKILEEENV